MHLQHLRHPHVVSLYGITLTKTKGEQGRRGWGHAEQLGGAGGPAGHQCAPASCAHVPLSSPDFSHNPRNREKHMHVLSCRQGSW